MIYRVYLKRAGWRIWTAREVEAFLMNGSPWLKAITRIERL